MEKNPYNPSGDGALKQCPKCGASRVLGDFSHDASAKDGRRSGCKQCHSIAKKKWISEHPEKVKEHYKRWYKNHLGFWKSEAHRKWAKNNPDKVAAISKQWAMDNPERVREIHRRSTARRRKTPKGKLSANISCLIWTSIAKGTKAGRPWEQLVGYTTDQLKKHLEKQFKPWMTWENYGKGWHVDHKIPISAFNFQQPGDLDFRRCWALKNLQPLDARENIKKGASVLCPQQPSLLIGGP